MITLTELQKRYNLGRVAIYNRLKVFSIIPVRSGRHSYITNEQLQQLDRLHEQLKIGKNLQNASFSLTTYDNMYSGTEHLPQRLLEEAFSNNWLLTTKQLALIFTEEFPRTTSFSYGNFSLIPTADNQFWKITKFEVKMNTKIIAFFNQSGGVSKTTLTMNLGYHLGKKNLRVLLIDMDPQASLTLFMGREPFKEIKTVYESLINDLPLPIIHNIHGIDLVPSNIKLSGAEFELVTADMRDVRLLEAINHVKNQYDFILIDCPPSLGILSYISLVAATHVLVPIQTHYKSFCGTELLLSTVSRIASRGNKNLKIAGFIPTMFAKSNSQDVRAMSAISEQLATYGHVFPAVVRSTAFADAAESSVPLAIFSPKHPALLTLNNISTSLSTL